MITEKEAIRLLDDKMFIIKQNIYNEYSNLSEESFGVSLSAIGYL